MIGLILAAFVGTRQYRKVRNESMSQPLQNTTAETRNPHLPETITPSSITDLARIEPPPYSPIVLRGADDEAAQKFHNAMRHYLNKDYVSAISGLRRVTQISPQAASANFYLGACYLLTNETDLAIQTLSKVISLDDPNYAEPAPFYLAKAYIRKNDLLTARVQLEKTVRLHGDREDEARQLEQQLAAWPRGAAITVRKPMRVRILSQKRSSSLYPPSLLSIVASDSISAWPARFDGKGGARFRAQRYGPSC